MAGLATSVVPACIVNRNPKTQIRSKDSIIAYDSRRVSKKWIANIKSRPKVYSKTKIRSRKIETDLLFHSSLFPAIHLHLTCISLLPSKTSYKYPKMRSFPALSKPATLTVKVRFTHNLFHPVNGGTLTSGCSPSKNLGPASASSRSVYGCAER